MTLHSGFALEHLTPPQRVVTRRHTNTTIFHTHGRYALAGVMTRMDTGSPTRMTNGFGKCSVASAATRMDLPRIRRTRSGASVALTPMSTRRSTSQTSISTRIDPWAKGPFLAGSGEGAR